jgi:hypothetical protein
MRWKALTVKSLVYFTLTVTLISIIFCVVYKAAYPTDDYINTDRHDQNEPTQRSDQISAIQQASPEPYNQAAQNKQSPFREWLGKWLEPITLLTALLVTGVGITNYIYYRQLEKMRETVALVGEQRDMMKGQWDTMKDQAITAQTTADAAKDSANVARQALHIAERPYLDIARFKVSPIPFESQKPVTYTVKIQNTGRTPAYDVWGGIYLTIRESEIFEETELDYPAFPHVPSKASFGAGRHLTRYRTTSRQLTDFDVERLDDGRLFLYVYGVEFYKDGFTPDIHRLAYCHQYNRGTRRMEVSPFHNSSD